MPTKKGDLSTHSVFAFVLFLVAHQKKIKRKRAFFFTEGERVFFFFSQVEVEGERHVENYTGFLCWDCCTLGNRLALCRVGNSR